tara:strand:- start:32588 stop:33133 length:546 start_codon:yes stop_codon:yes gene_type:complete
MEKSKDNNNKNHFLKEGIHNDISKHHKAYLGTDIPEGYFAKSKLSILDKIKEEVKEEPKLGAMPKKRLVFYMQPQFKYIAAASLVFMLSLTIWLQNANNQDDDHTNNIESLAFQNDVLLESLLVADEDVDAFIAATLFNEVLVKAELKEQNLDNLILDSLILEDSLLDDYMDDKFMETIIL